MPILYDVELYWLKANPQRPEQYKGKGRHRWNVQIRTRDKKEAKRWADEYGFRVRPETDDDDKIYYRATLSRPAYRLDDERQEDKNQPMNPPSVLFSTGDPINGDEVGNGSTGDVSFSVYEFDDGEKSRTLKTIVVRNWIKREPYVDPDQFEFGEGKIIDPTPEPEQTKAKPKSKAKASSKSRDDDDDDMESDDELDDVIKF